MEPKNENPNVPHAASAKKTKAERAAARSAKRNAEWDSAPALALARNWLRNPTPATVAFICADRIPAKWRALTLAAAALHAHAENACNGVFRNEEAESADCERATDAAREAARALFGPRARCQFNFDPRGLPLFVSWPAMPRNLRDTWDKERGLPIYFRALNYGETLDALAPDWNADAEQL